MNIPVLESSSSTLLYHKLYEENINPLEFQMPYSPYFARLFHNYERSQINIARSMLRIIKMNKYRTLKPIIHFRKTCLTSPL